MRISDWSSDVDEAQVGLRAAVGDQLHTARAAGSDDLGASRIVHIHHRSALRQQQLAEQPQLGVQVGRHGAVVVEVVARQVREGRSEEQTSELQSLMRISYAVF